MSTTRHATSFDKDKEKEGAKGTPESEQEQF